MKTSTFIIYALAILVMASFMRVVCYYPMTDVLNGTLEWCGGLFISMSVVALHRAKLVRGVSWKHVAFFSTWGFWNLYYYACLDQWFSWAGGAFLVATNSFWLCQIIYYLIKEKRGAVSFG